MVWHPVATVSAVSAQYDRWQVEQVLALAPKPSSVAAAQPLAVQSRWVATGCDQQAVWGRCTGTSAEPYECVVDHVAVAFRCSCPSRVSPCKHAIALLLLWTRGLVALQVAPPAFAASWLAARATAAPSVSPPGSPAGSPAGDAPANEMAAPRPDLPPSAPEPPTRDGRDDRVARMAAGLAELDRWLDDRLRTGLADPALARYETWDDLAARLVDAQVGGLANRVRRVAGMVGAHPQWHEHVLAELGALHLLAVAGRNLGTLPPGLADSVAAAIGWQVRQADVLAGLPHNDHWVVMGRSDTREDRIEVRRIWLRGRADGAWAMLLSFAAYGQSLDESFVVGTEVHADLFRYPGALGMRALLGRRHAEAVRVQAAGGSVAGATVVAACAEVGRAVAAEPWIDRYPLCVRAAPARVGARWVLTDRTGSLPLAEGVAGVGPLLAGSEGRSVVVPAEWTPGGLIPLALHLPDRTIDVGPTADTSFLAAAFVAAGA